MNKSLRRFSVLGAAVACALLTGCASTGSGRADEAARIVWPDPPQSPRIEYIRSVRYLSDIEGEPSMFGKILQGLFGRSNDKLVKPYGVVTDSQGRMYVADTARRAVYRFDFNGHKAERFSEFAPCGEVAAGERRLLFTALFSKSPKVTLDSPIGVAVDGQDNFYVSDSILGSVLAFDEEGHCLRSFGSGDELLRPSGIAINKRLERLYVTDTGGHKVVVYDLEGNRLFDFGQRGDRPGDFNFPTNIFIDDEDKVYVTDSLNFRVEVFTSEGEILTHFGQLGNVSGSFNKPKGIAVDSDGHIYVVDTLFDSVQIFDFDGRLLLAFGESGRGAGEFWLPSGIFIDKWDNIYVSDSYNTRVQVFRYLGGDEEPLP
jgi:DNA-binding beta-propeller fold protein YncE